MIHEHRGASGVACGVHFVGSAVHAELGESRGGTAREAHAGVRTEEDVAHGAGRCVRQATGFTALPCGDAAVLDGFDEGAAACPVDEGDLPAAAGKGQAARVLAFLGEDGGVGCADLGTSGEQGELGRCR